MQCVFKNIVSKVKGLERGIPLVKIRRFRKLSNCYVTLFKVNVVAEMDTLQIFFRYFILL